MYTAADAMVQLGSRSDSAPDSFDTARLGLFSGFGFYYGAVNYVVYRAIEKWPWGAGLRAAVGMSCFDIFIHLPFSFYVCQLVSNLRPLALDPSPHLGLSR